jgi:hypothetical protein
MAVLQRQWVNPSSGSFDDFGASMLALYVAATGDDWETLMFAGMDAVGPGIAPQRNDFSLHSLFFIGWMLVGCLTVINLFVGTVVDNFARIKAHIDGSALLTPAQRQWHRTILEASALKKQPPLTMPRPPRHPCLLILFELLTSKCFEHFMTIVVVSNVLTMALRYHGMEEHPDQYAAYQFMVHSFNMVYYSECALKLLAFGIDGYFSIGWNTFDFALVLVTLCDALGLLSLLLAFSPNVLRCIRVAPRIMRLIKTNQGLRDLLWTLVLSAPGLSNIAMLLALVTFIYAVLGQQLFAFVLLGNGLNDQRNFRTLGSSYLLLLQALTGDSWSMVMEDAMAGPERGCDPERVPTDCGSVAAIPFFITYTIVGTFVLLNLVIAVILENFSVLCDVDPKLISTNNIREFGDCSVAVHKEAAPSTTHAKLAELLLTVPPPLGVRGHTLEEAARVVATLQWPSEPVFSEAHGEQVVLFEDVIDALMQRNYVVDNRVPATPKIAKCMSSGRLAEAGKQPASQPSSATAKVGGRHLMADTILTGLRRKYGDPVPMALL